MLCVGKWIRKIFLLKVVLNLVVVFYPQRAAGNMCSQTLQNTIYTLQQHIRLLQHQMYTNCPREYQYSISEMSYAMSQGLGGVLLDFRHKFLECCPVTTLLYY